MTDGVRRRDQVLVRKSVGLRHRGHKVNQDMLEGALDYRRMGHMWACPGCGRENSPKHKSCRNCQSLKWGVAP